MNKKSNLNIYKNTQNISNLEKTPHEIVRFLMESLITAMKNIKTCNIKNYSKHQINDEQFKVSKNEFAKFQSKNISKALTIIYSLQTSLDFDKTADLANKLFQIYEYCRIQIINCLNKNNEIGLSKAIDALEEIFGGWIEIIHRKTS